EIGRDDERRPQRAAAQSAGDLCLRRDGFGHEPPGRPDVGHQPAALGRLVGVEHGQPETVYLARDDEAEREQRDERYADQDADRERVAERRPPSAPHERPDASPPHRAACARSRARRNTSVMGGSVMWTGAAGSPLWAPAGRPATGGAGAGAREGPPGGVGGG